MFILLRRTTIDLLSFIGMGLELGTLHTKSSKIYPLVRHHMILTLPPLKWSSIAKFRIVRFNRN